MNQGLSPSQVEYRKNPEAALERAKRYRRTVKGKASIRRNLKLYLERYPDRAVAAYKVRDALKAGRLTREPCCICGEVDSQGHHKDYSKPLEVTWLCRLHHRELEGRCVTTWAYFHADQPNTLTPQYMSLLLHGATPRTSIASRNTQSAHLRAMGVRSKNE